MLIKKYTNLVISKKFLIYFKISKLLYFEDREHTKVENLNLFF